MKSPVIAVRMPKETLERLDARATRERRNRSAMLLILVEDGLAKPPSGYAVSHPIASDDSGAPAVADGRAAHEASAR